MLLVEPAPRARGCAAASIHQLPRRSSFSETEGHGEGPGFCAPALLAVLCLVLITRPIVSSFASLPTERGGGLVDLLVARCPVRGANLDRRTDVVKLEVVRVRSKLGYADLVLGVTGVGYPLDTRGLVGVVARVGHVEVLVYVPALGLLVEVPEDVPAEKEAVVEAMVPPPVVVVAVVPVPVVVGHGRGGESHQHCGHHRDYPKNRLGAPHN